MEEFKERRGAEKIQNFYRLDSPRQKKVFDSKQVFDSKPYTDLYYGAVIGAHIAAYFGGLVRLTNITRRHFFIDPMTYIFTKDQDFITRAEGNFKKSYVKLLNYYGKVLKKVVITEQRRIQIKDFKKGNSWNETFLEELSNKVLSFQKRLVSPAQQKLPIDVEELFDKEEIERIYTEGKLLWLVPPYFHASNVNDDWYEISLKLANISQKFKANFKLLPIICISKDVLLDDEAILKVRGDYKKFDGVILWISDFNEHTESVDYLKGMIKLVSSLSESGKPIYSLYGGYFSGLLSKFGLTGFSAGICYGASKSADRIPTRMLPQPRYYVTNLHHKVPIGNARSFYGAYPKELCNCHVCVSLKKRIETKGIEMGKKPSLYIDTFFHDLDGEKAIQHFLVCRDTELEIICRTNLRALVERLNQEYVHSKDVNMHMYEKFENKHLEKWLKAVR